MGSLEGCSTKAKMAEVIRYVNAKHISAPGNWDLVADMEAVMCEFTPGVCKLQFTCSHKFTTRHEPRMQPCAAWACCEEYPSPAVVFTQLPN